MSASLETPGDGPEVEETKAKESVADFTTMIHETKVDGGKKSVWQMSLETLGMADGMDKKDDVIADTLDSAMETIQIMLSEVKDQHPKWQFTLTPLEQLNATMDDVLRAFVMWSKKEDGTTFNVSTAFRRLDTYATWMEGHRKDLEVPLTVDSIRAAALVWQLKITHADSGHLVWWIDLGSIDAAAVKSSLSTSDSLRLVVWQTHIVMLDKRAQDHGMVVVESMGSKGMIQYMTMIPMDLTTKLDRLTVGVLPIKMKACYIYNHRRWLAFVIGLVKPFMSKKMRSRIVLIPKKQSPQEVIDKEIGRNNIPMGFEGLEGTLEEDIIFGQYVK